MYEDGKMDIEEVRKVAKAYFPFRCAQYACTRMLAEFGMEKEKYITFSMFMRALIATSPTEHGIKLVEFGLFDMNNDGIIEKGDVMMLMMRHHEMIAVSKPAEATVLYTEGLFSRQKGTRMTVKEYLKERPRCIDWRPDHIYIALGAIINMVNGTLHFIRPRQSVTTRTEAGCSWMKH
ncbi:neuronal calcium sensor 1-like [Watersipora subatra]|uniref:neuronal calcium sensor 1-like n=1 Tax=Watersipora subatra TaxID=2589382 RepID=UPI00355C1854